MLPALVVAGAVPHLFCWPALARQDTLAPGDVVRDAIVSDDPRAKTPTLTALETPGGIARGRRFTLRSTDTVDVTVELRSWSFDGYLVLRDADGNALAEDDNGLFKRHARLELRLDPDAPRSLDVVALNGDVGSFELRVLEGSVAPPDRDAALAEIRAAREAAEDDRQYAWTLMSEIHWHFDFGDFATGAPLVEELVGLRAELYGAEHPLTLGLDDERAAVLFGEGRFGDATALLAESIARRGPVVGEDHFTMAAPRITLAVGYEYDGRYAKARAQYARAIAILRPFAEIQAQWLVQALCSAAFLDIEDRRTASALSMLEEAEQVAERYLSPDDVALAGVHTALALLHGEAGRIVEAERAAFRVVEINAANYGEDHSFTASARANWAIELELNGQLQAARAELERALATQERELGRGHWRTGTILGSLGWVNRKVGDLERAEEHLRAAFETYEAAGAARNPMATIYLADLADVVARRGRREEAAELLQRAVATEVEVLGRTHPRTVRRRGELGMQLALLGRMDESMAILEEALVDLDAEAGDDFPSYRVSLLFDVASVLRMQGRLDEALPLMEEALERQQDSDIARVTAFTAREQVARVRVDLGDPDGAWDELAIGAEAYDRAARRRFLAQTEAERFRKLASMRREIELVVDLAAGDEAKERIAYDRLLDWKGIGTRALWSRSERGADELSAEERETVEQLRANQAQLSRAFLGREDEGVDEAQVESLRRERAALERTLVTQAKSDTARRTLTPGDVAAALPPNAAFVDVFERRARIPDPAGGAWSEPRLTAWILRPDARLVRIELGPSKAIEDAVREYLVSVVGAGGVQRGVGVDEDEGDAKSARRLRELAWDPLADHLDGVDRLFVSPDGALAGLPLEVVELEDGSYLIEHVSVVYAPDALALVRTADSTPRAADVGTLLSVGGIDYAQRAASERAPNERLAVATVRGGFDGEWASLPATREESSAVSELHSAVAGEGNAVVIGGALATEERLKVELQRSAVAHIATHGFFEPEGAKSLWRAARREDASPEGARAGDQTRVLVGDHPGLLCGLVCSGASAPTLDGVDDGYLTAEEVSWLDMSATDLVVLSACDTALGRARSGEGLMGLRRAFAQAGARTVVSSLWSVEDEATRELMLGFYRRLWSEGMGPSDALRGAQLEMLRAAREGSGDARPARWGAFVVSGDWR